MQNDAKLGLLAGVVGVIIAATISGKSAIPAGNSSETATGTSSQSTTTPNVKEQDNRSSAPTVLPGELAATPVARKRDDATELSRTQQRDVGP
jgi:hypothetical protein